MIDPFFLQKRRRLWRFVSASIGFHLLLLSGGIYYEALIVKNTIEEIKKALEVRSVTLQEFQKYAPDTLLVDVPEATDSQKVDPKLTPEEKERIKTRFLGKKTQRVKVQTRAASKFLPDEKRMIEVGASLPKKSIKPGEFGANVSFDRRSVLTKNGLELIDPGMKVGAETMLNTDAYVHWSFRNRLESLISPLWDDNTRELFKTLKPDPKDGVYQTAIKINLNRSGEVLELELVKQSGVPGLDKAAMDAIRKARVFKNPPPELFKDDPKAGIVFTFSLYVLSKGPIQFNYQPIQR